MACMVLRWKSLGMWHEDMVLLGFERFFWGSCTFLNGQSGAKSNDFVLLLLHGVLSAAYYELRDIVFGHLQSKMTP